MHITNDVIKHGRKNLPRIADCINDDLLRRAQARRTGTRRCGETIVCHRGHSYRCRIDEIAVTLELIIHKLSYRLRLGEPGGGVAGFCKTRGVERGIFN